MLKTTASLALAFAAMAIIHDGVMRGFPASAKQCA